MTGSGKLPYPCSVDLLQTIRADIEAVPDGEHTAGLKAVLHHIEIAYRHLARGQAEGEDSAFNDAIYRTNQAFEGSIKEAYRVLAEKDPSGKTPASIEKYLEQKKIFKDRVLAQLKDYRTNWRNPSTHDYNLFFDQDEAFLAIVSVSAFSKLLIRQVSGFISFKEAKEAVKEVAAPVPEVVDSGAVDAPYLGFLIRKLVVDFFSNQPISQSESVSETRLLGGLEGYISTLLPDFEVVTDVGVGDSRNRVDMVVLGKGASVFVELKRWRYGESWRDAGVAQMMSYLHEAGSKEGVVVFYDVKETTYVEVGGFASGDISVSVVAPASELR
ncbi:hypothetical protein ACWGLL_14365 [Brevundimonas sp. NPDC055814]|uniref:Uncharacterized protein n=1 Tax=Brevundimonas olei TaxID=657642 RepID=A0ABZ2ICH7_9CAUL